MISTPSGAGESLRVGHLLISCSTEVTARHTRVCPRENDLQPTAYLALLKQKTDALDQVAPLAACRMSLSSLRGQMGAQLGKRRGANRPTGCLMTTMRLIVVGYH
jgi:hypothetical protein